MEFAGVALPEAAPVSERASASYLRVGPAAAQS